MRPILVVLSCLLSATLAAGVTTLLLEWNHRKQLAVMEQDWLRSAAAVRCERYWGARSGAADARYEFGKGRRGLLEVQTSWDFIETTTPGLRKGAIADIRRKPPLPGPSSDDILMRYLKLTGGVFPDHCVPYSYAWDYNVAMLQLTGRESDVTQREVSAELVAGDKPR